MTEGQLRSKRDEFWDTAPAFEGRKEIWDALKAAAVALEASDHELAQAIVDGASITLPHGTHTHTHKHTHTHRHTHTHTHPHTHAKSLECLWTEDPFRPHLFYFLHYLLILTHTHTLKLLCPHKLTPYTHISEIPISLP